MITEESYSIIDKLIQQGRCFALWRIPGEETIHFRMQTTGSPDLIYDLSALNGRSGFVIAPFHVSEKHPIVLIQPDCLEVSEDIVEYPQIDVEVFGREDGYASGEKNQEWEKYCRAFQEFWPALHEKKAEKLVLSRSRTWEWTERLSPGKAFFRACKHYIYSYVYLCHTPQTGTWMGGTPEILLAGEGAHWQTIALAGTLPWRGRNI